MERFTHTESGWGRSSFAAGHVSKSLRVQSRPKSVDFHDVENRQLPRRMTMRHGKDSYSDNLAWVYRPLPLGQELGVKIKLL
ncbi:hypothetical protein TNCV_2184111 [Trichonephila clavipes]|nr:hypothetical protein TNCV_2184111 [Trichonephila clavipes]